MSRSCVLVLAALVVLGAAPLAAGPDHWTEDGGETWRTQNEGLRPGEVLMDVAVAPSRPSTL